MEQKKPPSVSTDSGILCMSSQDKSVSTIQLSEKADMPTLIKGVLDSEHSQEYSNLDMHRQIVGVQTDRTDEHRGPNFAWRADDVIRLVIVLVMVLFLLACVLVGGITGNSQLLEIAKSILGGLFVYIVLYYFSSRNQNSRDN